MTLSSEGERAIFFGISGFIGQESTLTLFSALHNVNIGFFVYRNVTFMVVSAVF